jgi:uncharacterized protein YjdB
VRRIPSLVLALSFAVVGCSEDTPTEPEALVVTIQPAAPTIATGTELRLTATITRNLIPLFEWESDQPNIVSVTNVGLITGLQEGSATIRATWSQDSTVFGTTTVFVTEGVLDRAPVAVAARR